jgi:large subunit ribosomal protein L29
MAKVASAAELRGLSRSDLNSKVIELKEELFTLRFQAATGQLESHGRLRAVRKDIARIYTVLQERELGIIEDPDAQSGRRIDAGSRIESEGMRWQTG